MPIGSAITAILSIFLAFWFFNITRDPKEWRLRWMSLVGLPDLKSTREERRFYESLLKYCSYAFSLLCLVLAAYCAYLTIGGVKEMRRPKTQFEQDQQSTKKQVQEMGKNFEKLR